MADALYGRDVEVCVLRPRTMRPLATLTIDPAVLALNPSRRLAWLDYALAMLQCEVGKGEHLDSDRYEIMPPCPEWERTTPTEEP